MGPSISSLKKINTLTINPSGETGEHQVRQVSIAGDAHTWLSEASKGQSLFYSLSLIPHSQVMADKKVFVQPGREEYSIRYKSTKLPDSLTKLTDNTDLSILRVTRIERN